VGEVDANIVIIGGGAAGFFCAANLLQTGRPGRTLLLEKSSKLLAKVKVSGGGRCNVTHACFNNKELSKFYPRGASFLKKAFEQFSTQDTVDWFGGRSVVLHTEKDNRMFPESNDSQTIINCLLGEAQKNNVDIELNAEVRSIQKAEEKFRVTLRDGREICCNKILISSGGNPKEENYEWIKKLGHTIEKPIPSLFTFNLPKHGITELMGISVPNACIKIGGSKYESRAPLLITHWGLSGPSVLKLSAFGAPLLYEKNILLQYTSTGFRILMKRGLETF
jgi:predicted Rossmann fold flavoprotein